MPPHRGRGEERWAHLFTVGKSMPSFIAGSTPPTAVIAVSFLDQASLRTARLRCAARKLKDQLLPGVTVKVADPPPLGAAPLWPGMPPNTKKPITRTSNTPTITPSKPLPPPPSPSAMSSSCQNWNRKVPTRAIVPVARLGPEHALRDDVTDLSGVVINWSDSKCAARYISP